MMNLKHAMIVPTLVILFTMAFVCVCSSSSVGLLRQDPYLRVYTVDDYGAKSNGADDTRAFQRAWNVACATKNGILLVPPYKAYTINPIVFQGPCRSTTTVLVYGVIRASVSQRSYRRDPRHWLMFRNVDNLRIEGGGVIDGNGYAWWTKSCKTNRNQPCRSAPTAMTFYQCNNLKVSHLIITNAQQIHLTFQRCKNVEATDLEVNSPEWSPNTDGIHVTETRNITIARSDIKTGDDCISIVTGSQTVRISDISCGPGHGISIGSLGAGNTAGYVSDVYVTRATLSGSTNGLRIKTWQGGFGYVRNVRFEDITMNNVENPIIIDQHYCDQNRPCREQGSAVQVSNIKYSNIRGTSASKVAVRFDCSRRYKCKNISMKDINLRLETERYGRAEAYCSNVGFKERKGRISPACH